MKGELVAAIDVLPQLAGDVFLTDGGCETDFIFHHDIDLPLNASFVLHDDIEREAMVGDYFREYLHIASEARRGLVLETLTWRASHDWGELLGYDDAGLARVNRRAVTFLRELVAQEADVPIVLSGLVGPRGDAYSDLGSMTPEEAKLYHCRQIAVLANSGVDVVSALTITNVAEAIGIVQAAKACDMPVVISFTVETNGALPTGMSLADAIRSVDAATDEGPAYYMINCSHPDHFSEVLMSGDPVLNRIRGLRANASRLSHTELDEREELDDGDPDELGAQLAALHTRLPHITVLGGCCGTDARHIAAIARACAAS